jgi:hypothetical protein
MYRYMDVYRYFHTGASPVYVSVSTTEDSEQKINKGLTRATPSPLQHTNGSDFFASIIRLINNELERMWKEAIVAQLKYYTNIYLERLKKTTQNLSQDSRSSRSRFEPETSRIRSRSANHSVATFSHTATWICFLEEYGVIAFRHAFVQRISPLHTPIYSSIWR